MTYYIGHTTWDIVSCTKYTLPITEYNTHTQHTHNTHHTHNTVQHTPGARVPKFAGDRVLPIEDGGAGDDVRDGKPPMRQGGRELYH